jgi:DNA-binding PadR family transcriptional regulator
MPVAIHIHAMKPDYRAIALEFIREYPGATGYDIWRELHRRSRAAQWFGAETFWAELFGPGPGTTYPILWTLEGEGLVTSHWGVGTMRRGWHRPRHYYLKGTERAG